MQFETENFTDEEYLEAFENDTERAASLENESREAFEYRSEKEDIEEIGHQERAESGEQAVIEQKGGEEKDWETKDRGESGYRFDGQEIRDPQGNIWRNEDASLHQEMLAQWREGGDSVFFLPDYREQTANGEILYVTQLMLGADGAVTYEIHQYAIPRAQEDAPQETIEETIETYSGSRPEEMYEIPEANDTNSTPDVRAQETVAYESMIDTQEEERASAETTLNEETRSEYEERSETILRTANTSRPHSVHSTEFATRSGISPTRHPFAMSVHHNDNTRTRSTAHTRISKDGIILEMAA